MQDEGGSQRSGWSLDAVERTAPSFLLAAMSQPTRKRDKLARLFSRNSGQTTPKISREAPSAPSTSASVPTESAAVRTPDRLARARLIRYTCRQTMLIRANWNPAGPRSCPLYGLCLSWRTAYSMDVQYGDPRLRFPRLRRVSQSYRYVKLLPYPPNVSHGSLDSN
jgi:hypothetical protein